MTLRDTNLTPRDIIRARRTVAAKVERIRRNRRYGWMGGSTMLAIAVVAALLVAFGGQNPNRVTVSGHGTTSTSVAADNTGSGPPPTAPPTTFGGFPQGSFQGRPPPVTVSPPVSNVPAPIPASTAPPTLTSVVVFNPWARPGVPGVSEPAPSCTNPSSAPPAPTVPPSAPPPSTSSSLTILPTTSSSTTTSTTVPPPTTQPTSCSCLTPSQVAGGAYRCEVQQPGAAPRYFDPCWASAPQFACVGSPTQGTAWGFASGGIGSSSGQMSAPWAIQLSSGQVCTVDTISPPPAGSGDPYVCPGGGSAGAVVKSNTSRWTASVRSGPGAAPATTQLTTVWF